MINTTKIYLVTNIDNDPNKVYIGKTNKSREKAHKRTFGSQIIYTYIDEIFSLDRQDWKPLESKWIQYYIDLGYNVVNKRKVGGSGPEYYSEEIRQKMRKPRKKGTGLILSIAKKGIPNPKHYKPVLQYTKCGIFIKEWSSIKEASEILNIGPRSISPCCRNKTKSAGGFIWKFKVT
jgi:hypothetical protein